MDIRHIRTVKIQGKGTYTERGHTRKEYLYRNEIYTETYMEKGRHTQRGTHIKRAHTPKHAPKYTQKHTQKGDRHKDILGEGIYTEKGRPYKEKGHIRKHTRREDVPKTK